MKILVTGGSGMVGKCISEIVGFDINGNDKALKRVYNYTFLSSKMCNLKDRDAVLKYFNENKFDMIIHLAAEVGGLFKNMSGNIKMFSNNIKINENVLEASYLSGIKRGIFCLSSCIYPAIPSKFPMDETMIHESPPHPSNEGYAYAKRMLELQCRQYNKDQNTEYICLIPVNLYGKHDNFNLMDSHFIPGIMHRWHLQKQKNKLACDLHKEKYVLYGTGTPLRQFLYAPDFAKLILEVLHGDEYMGAGPMICCNRETTIHAMALNVAHVMGIKHEDIVLDERKSDGCMRKTVSNMKLQHYYPEFEFTEHLDGLKETYKWFCDNYDNVRK
tara:strand:+ start:625 stop:1614 length:990 start_codon:yes stop_codon:yes gene_type:complete